MPVLLYHAVTDSPGRHVAPFSVSPAEFARQLDLVLDAGYRCVTAGELVRLRAERAAPGRLAVITFDDGYADFATAALPALRARSLVSTLYVTTGWLAGGGAREPGPSDPMLAWSQLPELEAAGVELGAHSHSHPQLDTLGRAALDEELRRPKQLLEDALGHEVPGMAYPHGYSGPRVRRATRAAGYGSGAAVRNALHRPDDDPFAVSRLMLMRGTTTEQFGAWLAGVDGRSGSPLAGWATVGWRAYRRGRALVRRRPGSAYR
ncbi:polysaccharide deacetylase [Blastococcus xanthinilyticus]|uniref:Polysaccharide deacetylase n=1 Tax=Blastococcus xanthinilyticus TaxID=1564164 RepID=A0A5S5CTX8_9ACTN|nr:polysaccharide deacetylase [Blastococcus xanthinilyticus]